MVDPTHDPEFERELYWLYENLGRLSYYDFLGLRPTCDYLAVREAFHARAQRYHPDRFVADDTERHKEPAYQVYKRMNEAYHVLFDPELRAMYDAARLRGQGRLGEAERARRLTGDEAQVSSAFARIFLRAARAKLERGDLRGAWIDARLGLSLEHALPLVALLEELSVTQDAGVGVG